jgi:hypothetical protein
MLNQYMPLFIGVFDDVAPTFADMAAFVLNDAGRLVDTGVSSITVPTTAFSGVAAIYGNVYTEFPFFNGVPYADPSLGMKKVFIRAVTFPTPQPTATVGSLSITPYTVVSSNAVGTVKVDIAGIDASAHITGVQFSVRFDQTLFSVLPEPDGVVDGGFVSQFGQPFITYAVENDLIIGEIQVPPWPGENGWMSGGGTLVNIKLQPKAVTGGAYLALVNAFLVNDQGTLIPLTNLGAPGFIAIGKAASPIMTVTPYTKVLSNAIGTVKVDIAGVDADAHIVALQFTLRFNQTLFSVVDVTDGGFVSQFGTPFITWVVDQDLVVGEIQLPEANNKWPGSHGWMSGGGTLVNIRLKPKVAQGSGFLTLVDAFLVNANSVALPVSVGVPGLASITFAG